MYSYDPSPDLLAGRIILVTGAGAGIGRAVARRCAACGATVILLGRTLRKLEQVYDEIEQAGHPQPAIYPLNLEGASPKDYVDLADILEHEFGRLDGLLHNAVSFEGLTPIANYPVEHWYRSLQTNLNAPFLLSQALLGVMRQAADASIVFTADAVSAAGKAYWGAYAVAKGAIHTLMKLMAGELEANTSIRVNSIDPGRVRTALSLQACPAADPAAWPDPEAVTSLYLYLLGPDSKGVTGRLFQAQE